MNVFIMLAIVIANIIAGLLVYQFIKRLPKTEKTIFIGVSFAIVYVLVSMIYWISGFGIDSRINEIAKDFIIFTFVPVNVIVLIPFIASKYNKLRFKETSKEEFIKRLIVVGVIAIIILTCQYFYFKKIKQNIRATEQSVELKGQEVVDKEEKIDRNDVDTNEVDTSITNVEIVNEISNQILVNKENNTIKENYLE